MLIALTFLLMSSGKTRWPSTWQFWSPLRFCYFAAEHPRDVETEWRKINAELGTLLAVPRKRLINMELAMVARAETRFAELNPEAERKRQDGMPESSFVDDLTDITGLDLIAIRLGKEPKLNENWTPPRFIRRGASGELELHPVVPFRVIVMGGVKVPLVTGRLRDYDLARKLIRAYYYCR